MTIQQIILLQLRKQQIKLWKMLGFEMLNTTESLQLNYLFILSIYYVNHFNITFKY